jgi:hypothetical protein
MKRIKRFVVLGARAGMAQNHGTTHSNGLIRVHPIHPLHPCEALFGTFIH